MRVGCKPFVVKYVTITLPHFRTVLTELFRATQCQLNVCSGATSQCQLNVSLMSAQCQLKGNIQLQAMRSSLLVPVTLGVTPLIIIKIQATPPIPSISGLTKKRQFFNQEKTYSGLENQRRYWGGRCSTEGRYRGVQNIINSDDPPYDLERVIIKTKVISPYVRWL